MHLPGRNVLRLALLATGLAGVLPAGTYSYTYGTSTDLNLATFDNSGDVLVGVTTMDIQVSDLGLVDGGDSVTLAMTGLQYPYAGDLQVTLSLLDNQNNVLATGDVFNRIGKMSSDPNDFGDGTQFGDSSTIDSGNYVFCPPTGCTDNTGYDGSPTTDDLWATAEPLGSSDSIPSGNYWATTAFASGYDNLNSLFGGLPLDGIWQLSIYDYYPPFSGPAPFTPGITSWSLTIDADASTPEPPTAIAMILAAGLMLGIRRRKRACFDARG